MHYTIEIAGEPLHLLPDRAIFWPRKQMLLVADIHFGKAATFRAKGVPVPSGTTTENLTRLSALIATWNVRHIAFLGDFLHAKEAHAAPTLAALRQWRARHGVQQLTLVRGNHDAAAGEPPDDLGIDVVDEPWVVAPFALSHHPAASDQGYVLAGHLHPGYTLHGRGHDRTHVPCFWFGASVGVLPAFGAFTGSMRVRPAAGEQVYLAGPDKVRVVPAASAAARS